MEHEPIQSNEDQLNEEVQTDAEDGDSMHTAGDQRGENVSPDHTVEEDDDYLGFTQQEYEMATNPVKEMEERLQLFMENKRFGEASATADVRTPRSVFPNHEEDENYSIPQLENRLQFEGLMMQYGSFLENDSEQSSGSKSRKRLFHTKDSGMVRFLRDLCDNNQGVKIEEPVSKRIQIEEMKIKMPVLHKHQPNEKINALQQLSFEYTEPEEEEVQMESLTRGAVGSKPPDSP